MLPRKLIYTASIAALAFGVSQTSLAQSAATSPSTSANKPTATQSTGTAPAANLARGDRKFLEEAAQGGMAEVELGKLAQQKAASDQVKQFGKKMADDHAKANEELKKIASNKGVNLPTDLSSSDRREYDKLQKKSGADFDREYMKEMVSDHKKDVKDFQSEAKSAKDADIKNFAASTLPTLQQHLDLAQQTENVAKSEGNTTNQKTSSAR
jgi:putative membrane protein